MVPTKCPTTLLSYHTIQKYHYGALTLDIFGKNLIEYVKIQEKRQSILQNQRKKIMMKKRMLTHLFVQIAPNYSKHIITKAGRQFITLWSQTSS